MKTSETSRALFAAIFAASKDIGGAVKNKDNEFLNTNYADLPAVMMAYQDATREQDLVVLQTPTNEGAAIGVTTRVVHVPSGEWLEDTLVVPCKADPQGAGSAITYCRRYALAAIFQIPVVDDDAQAAMFKVVPTIGPKQVEVIRKMMEPLDVDEGEFIAWFAGTINAEFDGLENVTEPEFPRLVSAIQKLVKQRREEEDAKKKPKSRGKKAEETTNEQG